MVEDLPSEDLHTGQVELVGPHTAQVELVDLQTAHMEFVDLHTAHVASVVQIVVGGGHCYMASHSVDQNDHHQEVDVDTDLLVHKVLVGYGAQSIWFFVLLPW